MIAYLNGEFLDSTQICISPDDRGFLFSDGLYEVIRSYQGKLFKSKDHLDRLEEGARFLRFKPTDFSSFDTVAKELLVRNEMAQSDAVVYFQVTRGAALKRSHAFPENDTDLTVYAKVSSLNTAALENDMTQGIPIITVPDVRWENCHIKTTGLLANVLANQNAKENHVKEAVFVRGGQVLEGSHSNFFMVRNNTLITPPLSNHILGGITRKAVIELCSQENIPVVERPIPKKEMFYASEMFCTATSLEVTPVISFNGEKVGNGCPGSLSRRLQDLFKMGITNQTA